MLDSALLPLLVYHTGTNVIITSAKDYCFLRSLFVCLFVCLSATLRKYFQTELHEIFREGWQCTIEQMVTFWWRSGSQIRIRIRIATMVRRALAEVCTVSVLLAITVFDERNK